MSQNSCCVPGCAVVRKDGVPLHRFPNPETSGDKFKAWILNIGGEITILDHQDIYDNRRVCHRHFEDIHKYPTGRLSKLAIPTVHIPQQAGQQGQALVEAMVIDTSQSSHLQICSIDRSEHIQHGQSVCREQKIEATKSKGSRVTLAQHKEFRSVLKKLKKCEHGKKNFKAKYLMAKKLEKTAAFNIVCKNMPHSRRLFCQMQATQSGKKKKGRRFSLDEKILALSLYKPSPKAYRLLSRICVLPSRRTLQDLLHKVNLKCGINQIIFDNLKNRVNKMPNNHKYCCLVFDEMAIGAGISYDKRNDEISGFVNNGNGSEKEYCDHVLVFMLRGIVKKYKQPLAWPNSNAS